MPDQLTTAEMRCVHATLCANCEHAEKVGALTTLVFAFQRGATGRGVRTSIRYSNSLSRALTAAAEKFHQTIQQRHRERMLMPMLPGAQSK